jgi:predicted transposase YbfD/YdcC
MPTLFEAFDGLTDPRMERTRLHSLRDIVILSILAVICGADGFVQIEEFGKAKDEWLRKVLDMPNGIPSHDTIGRVFSLLEPEAFAACFMAWVGSVAERVDGEVIAIDGKTARRSMDGAGKRGPIHLVNAWATTNQLVLGQVRTSDKSNEITAIPELLRVLVLAGCIVTIDAMGCQKSIAAGIIGKGAHYILALKSNHPILHREVRGFFDDGITTDFDGIQHDAHDEETKAHDRDEVRRVWTSSELDWLPETEGWTNLRSLICVEAQRTVLGKATTTNRRLYISSIPDLSAAAAARAVRAHWGVENRLHWVLDVAFREDDVRARKGHAAENLATVRKIALNLLKQEVSAKRGIKTKRLRAGWDHRYLLKILGD